MKGWRREVLGKKEIDIIEGKIGIKFEKRRIREVELRE